MRLLRQIVKDHNVHRWIRSFMQAIPALNETKGGADRNSWAQTTGLKDRSVQKMPGVALVVSPPSRRPRYEMGKGAKLRVLSRAAGED
jgi:hypothetical protein